MAVLNLTLPTGESVATGKQITFEAPCPSSDVIGITIKGTNYELVDSIGNPLAPKAFDTGAMVSIILNNETKKAFIQNPSTTKYLEEKLTSMESIISDILYDPITIKSFTNNVNTKEIGSSVESISFSWETNKTPKTLTFDGATLSPELVSHSMTGQNFTSNKTFTLKATDDRGAEATKSTSISFLNGVYYGVATIPATLDSAFILTLTKELRSNKKPSFSVNAGAGEYIYYCIPKRFGTCSFTVGGYTGGFTKAETFAFTNAYGYTEYYDVYHSDYHSLGQTTVTVG